MKFCPVFVSVLFILQSSGMKCDTPQLNAVGETSAKKEIGASGAIRQLGAGDLNVKSGLGLVGNIDLIPQSICTMKADPGFCNLMLGRWYYDHRYHRCLPFLYTGCGGNLNIFISFKKMSRSNTPLPLSWIPNRSSDKVCAS